MRAKKSLGQNFLKSIPALRKIVEAGEIKSSDLILEIGPGKGVLTEKLLEKAGKVVAVEKDRGLFELLQEKFSQEVASGSLVLVHGDILEFDILKVVRQDLTTFKVIANIPYNITGAILKKFLTEECQPERMVLMVQHEVGKRITTPDPSLTRRGGKQSLLSISVKAYGAPKLLMKVPARYFSPAPKVDSAVILIDGISRKVFKENNVPEAKFWQIVKAGFAHKRKRLGNNLKSVNFNQKETLKSLMDKRAEELTLHQWISLAKLAKEYDIISP